MAQAFVSTYRNHYRGIPQKKVQPITQEKMNKILPDDDKKLWILVEEETGDSENLAKAYAMVKELEKKKNRSIYQLSYCRHTDQYRCYEQDDALDSQIIQYCKKLYGRRIERLLPPLPSARNVLGYMRRARLITPLTVYQNEYGKLGCTILKKQQS